MKRTNRSFNLTVKTRNGRADYPFNPPGDGPVVAGPEGPANVDPPPPAPAPTLGVTARTAFDALKRDAGAEIVAIAAGSVADQKRLRIGDVITSFVGERVLNEQDLARLEKELKPGMRVNLQYWSRRNNRFLNESIEFPALIEARMLKGAGLGVSVHTYPGGGVLVDQVNPGSPLEGVLQINYIVLELNDQRTSSKSAFDQAARSLKPAQQEISLMYLNMDKRPAERILMHFNMP
jgi:S1-C subfamily serine protease